MLPVSVVKCDGIVAQEKRHTPGKGPESHTLARIGNCVF